MNMVTQFSVSQPNKPGVLANLLDAIAHARVNLMAMTLVDVGEQGVIRLVAANAERLREVLRQMDVRAAETQVLAVDLDNRTGALAQVLRTLAAGKLSILYAYVTSGAAGGRTTGILKVNNLTKALKVLERERKSGKSGSRDVRLKKRTSR